MPVRDSLKRLFPFLFPLILTGGCALFPRAVSKPYEAPEGLFRGVFHVHTEHSHDSKASLKQVVKTARRSGADFVVITDHNTRAAELESGEEKNGGDPLVIVGEEVSTPEGHLLLFGDFGKAPAGRSAQALSVWARERGGFSVAAHPVSRRGGWRGAVPETSAGIEVYSFGHAFYETNYWLLPLRIGFLSSSAFLRSFQKKTPETWLAFWDERLKSGRAAGFGSADAHLHVKWLGWSPESFLLAFKAVTTYVRGADRSVSSILEALKEGRSFMAFEARGNASRFDFLARSAGRTFYCGDVIPKEAGSVIFEVTVPEKARIRLVHRGQTAFETHGTSFRWESAESGAWRVEVYRRGGLWILSNPIYKAGGGYLEKSA